MATATDTIDNTTQSAPETADDVILVNANYPGREADRLASVALFGQIGLLAISGQQHAEDLLTVEAKFECEEIVRLSESLGRLLQRLGRRNEVIEMAAPLNPPAWFTEFEVRR